MYASAAPMMQTKMTTNIIPITRPTSDSSAAAGTLARIYLSGVGVGSVFEVVSVVFLALSVAFVLAVSFLVASIFDDLSSLLSSGLVSIIALF